MNHKVECVHVAKQLRGKSEARKPVLSRVEGFRQSKGSGFNRRFSN